MVFKTIGNKSNPVILFFHAMGVIGESSMPVAEKMKEKYYCIMPTSTVYCSGQRYQSKRDEIQQIVRFLENHGIKEIELAVASSIGADLAMAFLTETKITVKHVFFDGGQFAQIGKATRRIMVPFLYIAMKSLYWSKGKTLKRIMWCDDDKIKPYFIEAGKNLTYGNLRRQLADSLEDKPFPELSEELQKYTFWEFGSIEEHFKYRNAVMQTYIHGNFPVFEGSTICSIKSKIRKDLPECSKKLLRQIDYLNWYFERRYQKNVIIVAKCIVLSAVCITDKMCSEERRA